MVWRELKAYILKGTEFGAVNQVCDFHNGELLERMWVWREGKKVGKEVLPEHGRGKTQTLYGKEVLQRARNRGATESTVLQ